MEKLHKALTERGFNLDDIEKLPEDTLWKYREYEKIFTKPNSTTYDYRVNKWKGPTLKKLELLGREVIAEAVIWMEEQGKQVTDPPQPPQPPDPSKPDDKEDIIDPPPPPKPKDKDEKDEKDEKDDDTGLFDDLF